MSSHAETTANPSPPGSRSQTKGQGEGDLQNASPDAEKPAPQLNNTHGDPDDQYGDGDGYDDEDGKPEGNPRERRKIEIKFILNKARRHITFSKRKHGIMKKAWELSVLTGTQVLLLVVSETGLVYTFTTPKLQPLVTQSEGKNLIQACLNAPETATDGNADSQDEDSAAMDTENPGTGHGMPQGMHHHSASTAPQPMAGPAASQQSPPTATQNIGNLMDPRNSAAYANVLAARKAQEADTQRLLQQQQQTKVKSQQTQSAPALSQAPPGPQVPHQQSLHSQLPPQPAQGAPGVVQPAVTTPGATNVNGASMVVPGAPGTASPQPAGQAAASNAAAALQAQAMAVTGLPPHLQQFAAQGYKITPQYGYQGYPFPTIPGQFGTQLAGLGGLGGQFTGQVGAPLDTATLLALQQQQQQQQQQAHAQQSAQMPEGLVPPDYAAAAALHAQRQGQPRPDVSNQPGLAVSTPTSGTAPRQPHYT